MSPNPAVSGAPIGEADVRGSDARSSEGQRWQGLFRQGRRKRFTMTRVHKTLSGHRVEYPDPDPKLGRFLDRVREAFQDPKKTDDDMIGLIYGRENPLLEATNGMVTREVFENPVYRVLSDLIVQKRVIMDGTDPERIAAKYTLTVADVAARKGVSEDAIRKAVRENRLLSWVKGGSYFFEPRSIEAVPLGTRGPMPKGIEPISY